MMEKDMATLASMNPQCQSLSYANRIALIEAQMRVEVQTHFLADGTWFSTAEVARRMHLSTLAAATRLQAWIETGRLISVETDRGPLFPAYAFDQVTLEPVPVLTDIITIFGERKSQWDVAAWLWSPNGDFGGYRPNQFLVQDPELLISAARHDLDELMGRTHG